MKKQFTILLIFIAYLLLPAFVHATSGACSWHDGVDCDRGWQADGRVYCNDSGWTDSMVYYDFMVMCKECNDYVFDEYSMRKRTAPHLLEEGQLNRSYRECIERNGGNYRYIDLLRICSNEQYKYYCPQNSREFYHRCIMDSHGRSMAYCVCNDGFYYESSSENCIKGEPPPSSMKMFLEGLEEASRILKSTLPSKNTVNSLTDIKHSIKEEAENKTLVCPSDYGLSIDKTKCIKIPENAHVVDSQTDAWLCNDGYKEKNNKCIKEYKSEIQEVKSQGNLLTYDNLIVKLSPEDMLNDYQQNESPVKESVNPLPVNIVGVKIKLFFNSLFNKLTNIFKF
ncbi:hypothetical protein L6307_01390 [Candidatus Parcubacteria bacterium]|nr:hypothetical protein [Patescibacteria group bacterium]MCG2697732.1 hypothetical protein [Candidatus Parcubacteria bacterium]